MIYFIAWYNFSIIPNPSETKRTLVLWKNEKQAEPEKTSKIISCTLLIDEEIAVQKELL